MSLRSGVILYKAKTEAPKREAAPFSSVSNPRPSKTSHLSTLLLVLFLSAATAYRYLPQGEDITGPIEELSYLSISNLEERFQSAGGEYVAEVKESALPVKQYLSPKRPVVIEDRATIHEPSRFVRAFEAPSSQVTKRAPSPAELKEKVSDIISAHGKKGVNIEELSRRIVIESISQKYDPLFVAAVIKSESAFNKFATSHVGAKGLMQIMPATGRFIEELKGFENVMGAKLTDPGYNVKLGITYLKHLDELFEGNRVFTLTAYNWGPGRMEDAFDGKRKIPKEVMNYALKILADHEKWRGELLRKVRSEIS